MHYCYFAHYLVNIIMDLARTIKIICTFMYTKRDKMHLLLFKHTLIRSKYKVSASSPHFDIPGIYNKTLYKWNNIRTCIKDTTTYSIILKYDAELRRLISLQQNGVTYEGFTYDILMRLGLRIACSDFSEFTVTYYITIFGKLLILSKLLKWMFYNGQICKRFSSICYT